MKEPPGPATFPGRAVFARGQGVRRKKQRQVRQWRNISRPHAGTRPDPRYQFVNVVRRTLHVSPCDGRAEIASFVRHLHRPDDNLSTITAGEQTRVCQMHEVGLLVRVRVTHRIRRPACTMVSTESPVVRHRTSELQSPPSPHIGQRHRERRGELWPGRESASLVEDIPRPGADCHDALFGLIARDQLNLSHNVDGHEAAY